MKLAGNSQMRKGYQPDIFPADHLFKLRIGKDNLVLSTVDLLDGAVFIRKMKILRSFQFFFQSEKTSYRDRNIGLF